MVRNTKQNLSPNSAISGAVMLGRISRPNQPAAGLRPRSLAASNIVHHHHVHGDRAGQAIDAGGIEDGDNEDQVDDVGADDGQEQQREDELGNGHQDVDGAGKDLVDPAAESRGEKSHRAAEQEGEQRSSQRAMPTVLRAAKMSLESMSRPRLSVPR